MARTVNHERRAQKKRDILDAALQCFTEKGFHSTSMQDVCRAAEMSPGTLYRYFASKDDIILAIVEEERQRSDELSLQISQSGDLLGTLDAVMSQSIKQSSEPGYAQLSAEIFAELMRNEDATELATEVQKEANRNLSRAIKRSIKDGKIDSSWNSDALAELLLSLIDTLNTRPAFMRNVSNKALHKTAIKLIQSIGSP